MVILAMLLQLIYYFLSILEKPVRINNGVFKKVKIAVTLKY